MINVLAMLDLYRRGLFPMGDPDSGKLYVVDPDPRTIIPLDGYHMSATLARKVRAKRFPTTRDGAFKDVMKACADRPRKWITPELEEAYLELHERGFAHSVESWKEGALAGGVFGLAIGGAFMAESMFHDFTDGGMVAVSALVAHLRERGFTLLDVQFLTPHLGRSGAAEISKAEYLERLSSAIDKPCVW